MNRLVWYAGLYATSAALLRAVGLVPFLWLARSLSLEDYAIFGLLYAIQTGVATFAVAGIVEVVVGLMQKERVPQAEGQLFAVANSAFIAMVIPAIALAWTLCTSISGYRENTVVSLVFALLSGALLAFSSLQAQVVRLQENHIGSLCFAFFVPLLGLIGSLVAFSQYRTVQSYFLGSALGLCGALLALWCLRIGFYERVANPRDARVVLVGVLPFLVVAVLGWFSGYGNNYLIRLLLKSTEVARFTFALSVSSIMQLIATALNQAWSPRFFRLSRELPFARVEVKNRMAFRAQGIALGTAGAAVIAMYPSAMKLLGGNLIAYQSMRAEILLLFVAYLFLIPWWHCQNYYLIHGKGDELMKVVLVTSVIGTVVWVALIWEFGPPGVYLGFFTQMLFRTVGIVYRARKHWPVSVAWDGVAAGTAISIGGFLLTAA